MDEVLRKGCCVLCAIVSILAHQTSAASAGLIFNAALNRPITVTPNSICGRTYVEQFCDSKYNQTCVLRECNSTCPTRTSLPRATPILQTVSWTGECVTKSVIGGETIATFRGSGPDCVLRPTISNDLAKNGFITFRASVWPTLGMAGTLFEARAQGQTVFDVSINRGVLRINNISSARWLLEQNNWNDLIIQVDTRNRFDIWVDGQWKFPGGISFSVPQNLLQGWSVNLGGKHDEMYLFHGKLKNVYLYSEMLTKREIKSISSGTFESTRIDNLCRCPDGFPVIAEPNSAMCRPKGRSSPLTQRTNHNSRFLEYVNDGSLLTSWVSSLWSSGRGQDVTVTLDLGNIYEVWNITIALAGMVPKTLEVQKRQHENDAWFVWHVFSARCQDTGYPSQPRSPTDPICQDIHAGVDKPLVFQAYRDISGEENRTHEHMTASHVRLVFKQQSYVPSDHRYNYYSVSEAQVWASCRCHGHASSCTGTEGVPQTCTCDPSSHTEGDMCQYCKKSYYRPSERSVYSARMCEFCSCNSSGVFTLEKTCNAVGGQCPCKMHADGRACDTCKNGYYNLSASNIDGCQPCSCRNSGTLLSSVPYCHPATGKCMCRRNVEGRYCDMCKEGYGKLDEDNPEGCEVCGCNPHGSVSKECDIGTGACACIGNYTGAKCNECKKGLYRIRHEGGYLCEECDCYNEGTDQERGPCGQDGKCICRKGYNGDTSLGGKRCEPYAVRWGPQYGPEVGKTILELVGGYFGTDSPIVVSIGGRFCQVIHRTDNVIRCETPGFRGVRKVPVILKLGIEVPLGEFEYKPNPQVSKIMPPSKSIYSGGVTISIQGTHLDSVSEPKLLTWRVLSGKWIQINTTVCHHIDSQGLSMDCISSNITSLAVNHSGMQTRMAANTMHKAYSHTKSRGRREIPTRFVDDASPYMIGISLDGIQNYTNLSMILPDYARMEYVEDPYLSTFDGLRVYKAYESSNVLELKGHRLSLGCRARDYRVWIGDQECTVMEGSLSDTSLACRPPSYPPTAESNSSTPGDRLQVQVKVGNLRFVLGRLSYEMTVWENPVVVACVFAAAGFILVFLIILVACLLVRKKRRKKEERDMREHLAMRPLTVESPHYFDQLPTQPPEHDDGDDYELSVPAPNGRAAANDEYLTPQSKDPNQNLLDRIDVEIAARVTTSLVDFTQLKLGKELGKGQFGRVYIGHYRKDDTSGPRPVAVKTVRDTDSTVREIEGFLQEATIMQYFDHANVLGLLGVAIQNDRPFVILPYMENGDLKSFISNPENILNLGELVSFGLQVAKGMSYLAEQKFIHRDLAARNCMINRELVVKIADFGLSRDIYEKDYYSDHMSRMRPLPVKWMAIECLKKGEYTTKSDVWSFGILMWELIMRGATPYPDVDNFNITEYLLGGRRLRQPDFASNELFSLMTRCWNAKPDQRPEFPQIVKEIEAILQRDKTFQTQSVDYINVVPS